MVSAIGKLATSVATKFGLCTRKAAMRLASETGFKLVDESTRLGRNLTPQEIEGVFKQTLPKHLRPKVLFSPKEAAKCMAKNGVDARMAEQSILQGYDRGMLACCVPNGTLKQPILMRPEYQEYSLYAHELEHALERNNRLKSIFARKILPLRLRFLKDKNKILEIQKKTFDFQEQVQMAYNPNLSLEKQQEVINDVVQKFIGGSRRTKKLCKGISNIEIPAYTTGGKVYAYENPNGILCNDQKVVADIYRQALNAVKTTKVT